MLGSRSSHTYLDENNGGANLHQTVELAKNAVLLALIGAVHEHLRDATDRKLLDFELDVVGVGSKLLGVLDDSVGESGRE